MLIHGVANGLWEALEAEFSHFHFILDRPYLKQHLHTTAETMELTSTKRFLWIESTLDSIDYGYVKRIVSRLKRWQGKGQQTILNE